MSEQVIDLPLPVQSQWTVVRGCFWRVLAALASGVPVTFVIAFVVSFVGAATRSASLLRATKEFWYLESLTILSIFMVSATYLYFARDGLKERLRQFPPELINGLRRPVSLLILVCVPLGLLGTVQWAMTTTQLTKNFLHDMPPIFWLTIAVLLVIVAPVAEEIFYRGYVWDRLSSIMPPWKAATISAALFLGSHLPNGILTPLLVLPLTIVLTVLRLRGVGVGVCVLAHGVYNGTIILGNVVQTYVAPLPIPS
ncbi:CPBP family intramembrane metalloprotease [Bradyrhizobium manausense]|uniref:CPBP family intramembrane glutamic endopeptidase n=1 Tax=Bradyrhizobium TaxID=374 RepID=UPI001BAAFFDD|nr:MULTISPECIES: type II CAAX endopeptidase family protein [Bradyrhizobium]MBR0827625.1 CPBP family intramembrane metalloprotease [Bradyrhizobium manausense]UVO26103.1 CPBP family intramembrane metalloprotease [Bradyrhizobium arachidis]